VLKDRGLGRADPAAPGLDLVAVAEGDTLRELREVLINGTDCSETSS
jgi:hypothetical protein